MPPGKAISWATLKCRRCGALLIVEMPTVAFRVPIDDDSFHFPPWRRACTRCRGDADIQFAEVPLDDETKLLVMAPNVQVVQAMLDTILSRARDARDAADLIAQHAPALRPLSDWLRANADRIPAWGAFLAAVFSLILQILGTAGEHGGGGGITPEQLRQIISQVEHDQGHHATGKR